MLLALPRIGIFLFGLGMMIYIGTHSFWGTLAILAIAYAVYIVGMVIWSIDDPGDASFS